MSLKYLFKEARRLIAQEQFGQLSKLKIEKPVQFNWAETVFEGINVAEHGEANALVWTNGTEQRVYTFNQVNQLTNQFLNFIGKHGIGQGDLFYTQLPLVPENWMSILASIKGGLRMVPAATTLAERDIVYRFQTLMPQLVIADHDNAEKIDGAERQLGSQIKLKLIVGNKREGWRHIDEILLESPHAGAAPTQADDALFYFFTSGTTGMPKVVTHTHFTYPVGHLSTASWIGLRHGDLHYNVSQPGWAKFAWSSFFAPWSMGATIFSYAPSKFDANDQLGTMEQYQVTTFCAPPTVLRMLVLEDLSAFQLNFRQCVAAGEPLNPDVMDKWQKGTGVIMRDGYGQTECTALVANLPDAPLKPGSMGKPTFLYDIIIANDQGVEAQFLEEGHICIKINPEKPNGLFIDYMGDTTKMDEVFKHGLYYTGDKAYRDEDGFIWFVGRDDDVIKASDYRVGPFEVESVLIEHDAVVESAVVASPHELRGYAVKAFVVLKDEVKASRQLANEVFDFCEKNLATYKIPRIIEFVPAFPKTISGKIRRIELRAREATQKIKGETGPYEFFHEKY